MADEFMKRGRPRPRNDDGQPEPSTVPVDSPSPEPSPEPPPAQPEAAPVVSTSAEVSIYTLKKPATIRGRKVTQEDIDRDNNVGVLLSEQQAASLREQGVI